jgi:signal transduction histidine kinase
MKLKNEYFYQILNSAQICIAFYNLSSGELVWESDEYKKSISNGSINFLRELNNVLSNTSDITQKINDINVDSLLNTGSHLSLIKSGNILVFEKIGKNTLSVIAKHQANDHEVNSSYLEEREDLLMLSRTLSIGEMASTLAHEINQPIGAVHNLLKGIKIVLQRDAPSKKEDYIKIVEKAAFHLEYTSEIIKRIREYTTSYKPEFAKINANKIVNDCLSLMDWELKKRDIIIKSTMQKKKVYLNCDETMIRQVITNVLRNAINSIVDYSIEDGFIEIACFEKDGHILFKVSDNGCGVGSEQKKGSVKIKMNTNIKRRGMGIGINICRSLLELHSGRYWITPNSERGSTAYVELPVAKD